MIKLTRVEKAGTWYYHLYELNGEFFTQECTKEEYESLGLPNAGPPSLPQGARWINSGGNAVAYDTPSKSLENGQYAEHDDVMVVKLEGLEPIPVTKESIVSDTLDQKTVDEIQAYKDSKIL